MKFVKKVVKYSEVKGLMGKMAARLKAGEKEFEQPLKSNIETVEAYKGISPNGVIDPKEVIVIEVEEKTDPTEVQNHIMIGVDGIKKSVDEVIEQLKKMATEGMAKADPHGEARYMLEQMAWRFQKRMNQAHHALDTLDLAVMGDTGSGGASTVTKEDLKKMLDVDAILAELGEEAIAAVKKMFDEHGSDDSSSGDSGSDDTGNDDSGSDDADDSGSDDAGDTDDFVLNDDDLSPPLTDDSSSDDDGDDDYLEGVEIE